MAENNIEKVETVKYSQKAVTVSIKATSRQSVKIKDSYYTVEFEEERMIPQGVDVDLDTERFMLWNTVNEECDNQILEINEMWRKHDEEIKRRISHN